MKKYRKRPLLLETKKEEEKGKQEDQMETEERILYQAKETRDKFLEEGKLPQEYLKLVKELKDEVDEIKRKEGKTTARVYVPKLYWTLKKKGFSIVESREITIADVIDNGIWGYWSFIEYLPEEAKHAGRRKAGLASARAKQMRGLALADPETRSRVARQGYEGLDPDQMQKNAEVSGRQRTEIKNLKEDLEEKRVELEEIREKSVVLPHRFTLTSSEIEDIVELAKDGKRRIELELRTPTRVIVL